MLIRLAVLALLVVALVLPLLAQDPSATPADNSADAVAPLPPADAGPSPWHGVEPAPRLRYPAIAPDGRTIVASFNGDLIRVPIDGGEAVRLTSHVARELRAVISPDGRDVFYASAANGNYDVWRVPLAGGVPRQITFHEAAEFPAAMTPDGQWLLFYSWRDGDTDLFATRLGPDGGETPVRLTRTLFTDEQTPTVSPDGRTVAFSVYGNSTAFMRPDYRGVGDCEICIAEWRDGQLHDLGLLTANGVHDSDPVFTSLPDGEGGRRPVLVWTRFGPDGGLMLLPTDAPAEPRMIHAWADPQFPARVPGLAPTDAGFIGVMEAPDGGLLRLDYSAADDRLTLTDLPVTVAAQPRVTTGAHFDTRRDVTEFTLSPDGKKLAYVVHGDVFVTAADGSANGTSLRLTVTGAREWQVTWAPDSQRLAYTTLRRGNADIVLCTVATGDERFLCATPADEAAPLFAPKGDTLAYLRDEREQRLVASDGTDDRLCMTGAFVRDSLGTVSHCRFSPDGHWLALTPHNPENLRQTLWVTAVDGSEGPHRVATSAESIYAPVWTPDGKALTYTTRINADFDTFVIPLTREPEEFDEDTLEALFPVSSAPDAPVANEPAANEPATDESGNAPGNNANADADSDDDSAVVIDFDRILERAEAVAESGANEWELIRTGDGKRWVYQADIMNGYQFWSRPVDGGRLKQLTDVGGDKDQVQLSPDGKTLWFLHGMRVHTLDIAKGQTAVVPTRAVYTLDRDAERLAVYEEIGWVIDRMFYRPDHLDKDWRALHDRYRPQVLAAANDAVFRSVCSELMGQLNFSHLGVYARPGGDPGLGSVNTGETGIVFDDAHLATTGELRVAHVLPDTPAGTVSTDDDAGSGPPRPGEYLRAVDGHALTGSSNLDRLLAGTQGRRLRLTLGSEPPGTDGEERTIAIRPVDRTAIRNARYEAWVRERRARVDALSGGDFGYVHIRAMNGGSLTRFRNEAMGRLSDRKGLLIDVRNNGGGYTAVQILDALDKQPWLIRSYRGFGQVSENLYRDLAWEKPAACLCNRHSFSNAEIFAEGFRRLRIGPVVGTPTAGGVIGTSSFTLLDGSRMRVPFVGAYTVDAGDLERNPREPHVMIDVTPADRAADNDPQLEAAVRELRKQVLWYEAHGERPYTQHTREEIEPQLEQLLADWEAQQSGND